MSEVYQEIFPSFFAPSRRIFCRSGLLSRAISSTDAARAIGIAEGANVIARKNVDTSNLPERRRSIIFTPPSGAERARFSLQNVFKLGHDIRFGAVDLQHRLLEIFPAQRTQVQL